ncbi:hypothetical protein VHEMI09294 [[Torrubiella] hemipterigena]|uniref:Uncharacterized protein n=1 Tax=[Torrubiella] hemipterigena TaxID=1531966 RepID=A0A0A1TQ44_9HYPO|nr:hypothetical protein VHEMI09294 [[Torrubiella] hemipterigena]
MTDAYDRVKGDEEHILKLADGRQLAYACNGPRDAKTVIIFFAGLFSVGTAHQVPVPCADKNVLWIAPTLAGMGNSSSRDPKEAYHVVLARDISALLKHFYPSDDYDALYVAGGSYGTVQAQMLYGAPYDLFPAGKKIAGCFLLAGFSPFKYDKNYTKALSWQNWMSVGPPSQMPFRMLQKVFKSAIGSKMGSVEGAKTFLDQTIFGKMSKNEKDEFAQYAARKGFTVDEFIDRQARGAVKSSQNWDGFMEVSDVLHSDWGFNPATLDDEHAQKPVLVVGSEHDELGGSNNAWLVANYKSATEKTVPGGHLSTLYYMDELWADMFKLAEDAP